MKMIIVVTLALLALTVAAPLAFPVETAKIIRSDHDQQPEGSYGFSLETENGIVREEKGEVREILDEEKKSRKVVVVHGSYSYPSENGKPEVISYFADETGYHAEGKSIPKAVSRRQIPNDYRLRFTAR